MATKVKPRIHRALAGHVPPPTKKRTAKAKWKQMVVPPGWVGLESLNPQMLLLVRLDDPPVVADGLTGWVATDRPQQTQMSTWKGNDLYTLALSVLFDGFADNRSVEPQLRLLYDVARGKDSQPGTVEIYGVPSLPVKQWVIQGLDPGDVIRREDGSRVRQHMVIQLLEYQPPEWLSLKKSALQGAKAKTHMITVKHKDTAYKIALRHHIKWTVLRQLNPSVVHTANALLKPGTKLRAPLPAPSSHKAHSSKGHKHG